MREQLKGLIRPIAQRFIRGLSPVRFENGERVEPISRTFGLERGTPIDRFYIDTFLRTQARHIRGVTLEVASDGYTRKFGENVTRSEVLHVDRTAPGVTMVGDLASPDTLPEGTIDCFICTQTFNFIFDVQQAARGVHRLLRPSGVFLATIAGLCQISRYDMDRWGDYWRFTSASARRLFEPLFDPLEIKVYGNFFAARALLDGVAVEELPSVEPLLTTDEDYQVVVGVVGQKK